MKLHRIDLIIIVTLVGLVFGIRLVRGNSTPLTLVPAKIRGNPNAPVSIVEFTDYQCPYCKKIQPTLHKLLETFPDDLRIIYKHYPLDFIHSHSRRVSEAAECAADQNQFWNFTDVIYDSTLEWGAVEDPKLLEPLLDKYALKVGLNMDAFHTCLDSGVKKDLVEKDRQEGKKLFVSGTPTLLINGTKVVISHDFEKMKSQIAKEVEKAKR